MDIKSQDVILSCRVRLARNIKGLPFVGKLSQERANENINKVYSLLRTVDKFALSRMSDISTLDARVMQEKRLISEELVKNKQSGAVIIDENEQLSIMVNEEDHLRLQCFANGLDLYAAYNRLSLIDDLLSRNLFYSYDTRLGYLTSCITNVGTGMRAGALLFLPGLGLSRALERTIGLISNYKISIRGFYGEGSDNEGHFYQISNQRTLGLTELEIVESVTTTINNLMRAEFSARQQLYKLNQNELKDRVQRAYGVLTNAHMLTSKEVVEFAALVKLGHSLDIIKLKDHRRLDNLIQECQPASITALSEAHDPIDRDIFRAKLAKKAMGLMGA